jgi:AcrR family transcriptional regulator
MLVMAYRPTERTRARAAAARERVVTAALDQLADGGYASASMVAVARRAGVATGSVYRHFPSKGDLFAEVFRRAAQREVDVLTDLGHRTMPVRDRLAAWVDAFVHRALAEPVRAYALIAEPVDPAVEAERLTFRQAYADLFARALREGMESGDLPRADPQLAAAAIVGALAEALLGPLARAPQADAAALSAGLQSFVLSAVGAESHAAEAV